MLKYMNNNKYLEYYMDSKVYSNEEIQNSISETKKQFLKKDINVNIHLNEFGVYVITYEFENKNTYFNKMKILFRRRKMERVQKRKQLKNNENHRERQNLKNTEKINKRFEKYSGNNRYGKYIRTGVYLPY